MNSQVNPVPRIPRLRTSGWGEEIVAWVLALAILGGLAAGFCGLIEWIGNHL